MNRAIITGATGTIGIALIEKLVEEGMEVLVLCHKNSQRIESIPKSPLVHVNECDMSDYGNFNLKNEEKFDVFYHLAWSNTTGEGRNNMEAQIQNIEYTLDAVNLADRMGCKVFVGAGSQAEYGRSDEKLNGKTPTFPENGYGMAKLCAGQMSRIECSRRKIKHIWTRILSVYGPYDGKNSMISSLISSLLENKSPALTKGEQRWDYLYCKDAANALYLLGEKGIDGKIYCIGSGEAKPLKEYILEIGKVINPQVELGFGKIEYSNNQVMNLCADISELTEDTGFEPKVKFSDGIKETINWIKGEKRNAED